MGTPIGVKTTQSAQKGQPKGQKGQGQRGTGFPCRYGLSLDIWAFRGFFRFLEPLLTIPFTPEFILGCFGALLGAVHGAKKGKP